MGSEIPVPPEYMPTPQPAPRKRRTKLYIGVGLATAVVVISFLLGTYLIADSAVNDALKSIEVEQGNVEIKNIGLFPPSIDATVIIILRNPSDIDLQINSLKAEMFISSGTAQYLIGSSNVKDKPLPSHGMTSVPFDVHVISEAALIMASGSYTRVFSGQLSVSGKSLFWVITKEKTQTSTG